MKRIIKFIILIIVVGVIGYLVYKYFINCDQVKVEFDREFTLEKLDYGTTKNGIMIKLMDIEDRRCPENETCYEASEQVAKLLIIKNPHISYIELGPMSNTSEKLEKMKAEIYLSEITEDGKVTLKVINKEK